MYGDGGCVLCASHHWKWKRLQIAHFVEILEISPLNSAALPQRRDFIRPCSHGSFPIHLHQRQGTSMDLPFAGDVGGSTRQQAASVTSMTSSTARRSHSYLLPHTHTHTYINKKRKARASILFNEPDLFFASFKVHRGFCPVVEYRPLHFHPWTSHA